MSSTEKLRAVVALGGGRAGIVDGAPAELAPGQVRIATRFVGVCHSDIGTVRSATDGTRTALGHEVSGIVVESRADSLRPGRRVAACVGNGYADEFVVDASQVVPLVEGCSLLDGALSEPLACVLGGLEQVDCGLSRTH